MENKKKPIVTKVIEKKIKRECKNPNYEMKCIYCGDIFQATRKTALFCSSFCRIKYNEREKENEIKQVQTKEEPRKKSAFDSDIDDFMNGRGKYKR